MIAPGGGRWNDLQTRVMSAVAMLVVGAVDIWLGGPVFLLLVAALTAVMIWELCQMTRPDHGRDAVWMALIALAAVMGALTFDGRYAQLLLLIVPLSMLYPTVQGRLRYAVYAGLIVWAGYGLVTLRDAAGSIVIVWLVGVVITSDVLGYFAGRQLGGAKFWPAISPKKTWSGTVAGWIGAALVGLGFVLLAGAGWGLVILSPIVAFAGQMGDIAESWIKRRTGVKDSSALIPGHGGVLDRFDALIFAVVAVMLLGLFGPLPIPTES